MRVVLWAILVAMFGVGCMDRPRHEETRPYDAVHFEGYASGAGQSVPGTPGVDYSVVTFYGAKTIGGPEEEIAEVTPDWRPLYYGGLIWYQYILGNQTVPDGAINCEDPNAPYVWIRAEEAGGIAGHEDLWTYEVGVNIDHCRTSNNYTWQGVRDHCTTKGIGLDGHWAQVYLTGYTCPPPKCDPSPEEGECDDPEEKWCQTDGLGKGDCVPEGDVCRVCTNPDAQGWCGGLDGLPTSNPLCDDREHVGYNPGILCVGGQPLDCTPRHL